MARRRISILDNFLSGGNVGNNLRNSVNATLNASTRIRSRVAWACLYFCVARRRLRLSSRVKCTKDDVTCSSVDSHVSDGDVVDVDKRWDNFLLFDAICASITWDSGNGLLDVTSLWLATVTCSSRDIEFVKWHFDDDDDMSTLFEVKCVNVCDTSHPLDDATEISIGDVLLLRTVGM